MLGLHTLWLLGRGRLEQDELMRLKVGDWTGGGRTRIQSFEFHSSSPWDFREERSQEEVEDKCRVFCVSLPHCNYIINIIVILGNMQLAGFNSNWRYKNEGFPGEGSLLRYNHQQLSRKYCYFVELLKENTASTMFLVGVVYYWFSTEWVHEQEKVEQQINSNHVLNIMINHLLRWVFLSSYKITPCKCHFFFVCKVRIEGRKGSFNRI